MNYKKLYQQLIDEALKRQRPAGYSELHHIVPRCRGGGDEPENLVRLTGREHFIAHRLLSKSYPDDRKLLFALGAMLRKGERKLTSRQFEVCRKAMSEAMLNGTHHWQSREFKASLSARSTEQNLARVASGEHPFLRPEVQAKARKGSRAAGLLQHTCPHCGKEGRGQSMFGYHFDNCKHKPGRKQKETASTRLECPHCCKVVNSLRKGPMMRWHFDNCKQKP